MRDALLSLWRVGARAWVVLPATALTVAALIASVGSASPPSALQTAPSSTPLPGPGLGRDAFKVTLITGDVIRLTAAGGGYKAAVEPARRPDGSTPTIKVSGTRDALYAIPDDVVPFLAADRLDRELFNVTRLATAGYHDEARASLPVIVEYPDRDSAQAVRGQASDLPASRVTRLLESIDAAAVTVRKEGAERFWAQVRGAQPDATGEARLRGGADKLWLDAEVHVNLNESVPLVGAPEAWAAGYDGTGVEVAVLDTGIDETHPDVAGQAIASRSFVSGESVVDGHGHGTHVAATIAGTGAAQDGTYRGVAPGARLVVGKVLADRGEGPISGVIEGMQWAAREQGVDIVSMSLGTGPTDGTDPLSQAVEELTAATGTLFVIAAGNRGSAETVEAPGAAQAALTVGAVEKTDTLASFSSRGPRLDGALKPDITAPGVAIVAARAAGTGIGTPVDDRYTRANGTSMATPHVAGAAAVLAQRNPSWSAAELKSALMSTSRDGGYTVYEQGAGRVDLGRAVRENVFAATSAVDFKIIAFDDDAPRTATVTFSNTADQPVTLDLASSLATTGGTPVPDGVFTTPSAVTVPAAGSASIEARLDPAPLARDQYSGAIVASGPDGTRLRVPVGFAVGALRHRVTINIVRRQKDSGPWLPRNQPECANASLFGADGDGVDRLATQEVCWHEPAPPTHRVTFLAPPGTYFAQVDTSWRTANREEMAYLFAPEFEVTGDTEVTLDADAARRVTVDTPHPTESTSQTFLYSRKSTTGQILYSMTFSAYGHHVWWVNPTEPVTRGEFAISPHSILEAPRLALEIQRPRRLELEPFAPTEAAPFSGERTLDVVYAGRGTAEDFAQIDARGKLVVLRVLDRNPADPLDWWTPIVSPEQLQRALAAGAEGVLFHPEAGIVNWVGMDHSGDAPQIPWAVLEGPEADLLIELVRRTRVRVKLTGTPPGESPYLYNVKPYTEDRIAENLHHRFSRHNLAVLDGAVHADEPGQGGWWLATRRPSDPPSIGGVTGPLFTIPRRTTHFIGPVYPDALYSITMNAEEGLYTFAEPERRAASWNAHPIVPGPAPRPPGSPLPALCAACRELDTFYPLMSFTTPEELHQVNILGFIGGAEEWHLYRDGREIPPRHTEQEGNR